MKKVFKITFCLFALVFGVQPAVHALTINVMKNFCFNSYNTVKPYMTFDTAIQGMVMAGLGCFMAYVGYVAWTSKHHYPRRSLDLPDYGSWAETEEDCVSNKSCNNVIAEDDHSFTTQEIYAQVDDILAKKNYVAIDLGNSSEVLEKKLIETIFEYNDEVYNYNHDLKQSDEIMSLEDEEAIVCILNKLLKTIQGLCKSNGFDFVGILNGWRN